MAKTKAALFADAYEDGYVSVRLGSGVDTMKLRSRRARAWLDREYFATFGRVASGQSKTDAIALLEGLALHEADPRPVFVRTGEDQDRLYIDLGDDTRELVEVSARGWRIVGRAPVPFVRPKGMLPLPRPAPGGSVDELREFVNVKDDSQFRLLVAWIVAAQRPRGPYPILCIQGEHGSSKSTTTRLVRRLVDPNALPVRAAPRELRDLAVAGRATHVLAFDNLSGVPVWLSDALCRVATGGGFATRALFTDDEEVIFDFLRPVILNGIDDVATRPDLADRTLVVRLPAIPSTRRRREEDILVAFARAAPRIYGAVLSAVVEAMAQKHTIHLPELPRMADFAVFATAAEPALGWAPGAFMDAYIANLGDTSSAALEADVVAQVVVRFVRDRHTWSGSAQELLDQLRRIATEQERESRAWPSAANHLSARIRRCAPVLRDLGINVEMDQIVGRDRDRRRVIALETRARSIDPIDPAAQVLGTMSDSGAHAIDPAPRNHRSRPDVSATLEQGSAGQGDGSIDHDPASDAPFASWLDDEGIHRRKP